MDVLRRRFTGQAPGAQLEIEMVYWMKRTSLEIIGQGGLGYSFGALDDMSTNEYTDSIKNFACVTSAQLLKFPKFRIK